MSNEGYSVKINRRDGVVEVLGPDKEWIAEQVERLAVVYTPPVVVADEGDGPGTGGGGATTTDAPTRRRRSRPSGSSTGGPKASKQASEVNDKLTSEQHGKLEKFVTDREAHFKSRQDQAAIIAIFLEDELGFDGITAEDLGLVYEIMGWRAPVNPRAVINNARERNGYFRSWVGGRARLTVTGQNFGRHDSKGKGEAE